MSDVVEKQPLTEDYLKKMDAYWRAANYLGAAQLYLLDYQRSGKEKDCWSLGNRTGTELCLCTFKPCDQKV